MNKLPQIAVLWLVAAMLAIVTPAHAELNLDFDLVNKTGYAIKEVYVAPSSSDDWEENILKENLEDEETLEVSFSSDQTAKKWDLRIVFADGSAPVYWKNYNLTEISKLTLFYNHDTDVTSAKAE